MKRRGDRIVMITAYDAPSGRIADAAGVDMILVGDSAAMVMLGHDSTVPATMDEMIVLTRAVNRGRAAAARRRRHAVRLVPGLGRAGARERDPLRQGSERRRRQAGGRRADAARASASITGAGVPVMGHIGLTPQIGDDARRLQGAGADRRAGRAALRGRARAPGGGLLRDRPRGRADPGRRGDHAVRSRSRRSASAQAPRATARCSCGTTCSGCTTVTRRGSSSSTRSSRRSSRRPSRTMRTRCGTARSRQQQHTYSIPEEELALFEEAPGGGSRGGLVDRSSWSSAQRTTSARESAASLRIAFARCISAVLTEMLSRSAIAVLV